MEHDEQRESTAVTRSQNVVLTLPHDWRVIPQFMTPALERLDAESDATQLVVLTPDAEATVAVAQAARAAAGDEGAPRVVAATSARRAARLLAAGPAHAVVGAPAEIAGLIASSALKLDGVRSVVIAWADDLLESGGGEAIEGIMAELPKEASRTVVVAHETAAVAELVERYLRRARRVGAQSADAEAGPLAVQYVSVAPVSRPGALRRLLDELDPPSAAVVTRTPESEREVRATLRALGYDDETQVRVSAGDVAENTALVVLYDLPATRQELEQTAGAGAVHLVAFAQPRQLGHLRAVAGGPVTALTLPEPAAKARGREEKLRSELRALLVGGAPSRELLAIEPLLEEFDGVEIAAAAVKLVERERDRVRTTQAGMHTGFQPKGTGSAASTAGMWKRIFMTVGEIDGATRGDLVGAITGEAGITSEQIGKIELRENHALVEISAADAERVAERMNGATVRGRRVVARLDQERAAREGGAGAPRKTERAPRGERPERPERGDRAERGERPPRRFERDDRPARGGAGFERGSRGPARDRAERGARPARPFSRDRDERAPRRDFGDRPARPQFGGERSDRAPRSGGGGGRFERDDRPGRRPGPSERAEWSERGDRLRNARRPRDTE